MIQVVFNTEIQALISAKLKDLQALQEKEKGFAIKGHLIQISLELKAPPA
jgi:hypothetical protein